VKEEKKRFNPVDDGGEGREKKGSSGGQVLSKVEKNGTLIKTQGKKTPCPVP